MFSDNESEGAQFEGEAKTDSLGVFTFAKGSPFTGPNLTAIATDAIGNSSEFSLPITGISLPGTFQEGNTYPKLPFQSLRSGNLTDNRIGAVVGWPSDCQVQYYEDELFNLGAKWVKISINEIEPESVLGNGIVSADWGRSEFSVSEDQEKCIEALLDNGFTITYILSFWDKANHPEGWERRSPDFVHRRRSIVTWISSGLSSSISRDASAIMKSGMNPITSHRYNGFN